ncbi:MAG: leucine-rich repeat domain-containing protein [Ruminococcus sp.]|nr:leucine-rich repeat domain-containing protein [Ruminococcus sp.]
MTSVVIPESVTSIGWEPFYGCYSLTAIIVDDNNSTYSSIDGVLFDKNLETLISCPWGKEGEYAIPDSVTSIGKGAFYSCEYLTSVVIPDGVTNIGGMAFEYCYSLTDITIPDSVISIGSEAFECCYSLTDITIPNSVTSIGNGAFYYCTSLTDITIPDSVISIGSEAFECCYSLTSITFLNPDCEIYDSASTICNGWEDVYDDDGYYSGDYCYYNGVIYGYDGSTAETYAEIYGYTFVSLGETPALSTGDSEITV